jgi:hypothetical protein
MHYLTRAAVLFAAVVPLFGVGGLGEATTASVRAQANGPRLDIAFTQGSTTVVPEVSVSVAGTYSCGDGTATHQVPITVTLAQGTRNAEGSTTVNCGDNDGNWTVLVLFPLVAANTGINANAIIDDGSAQATASAHLVRNTRFLSVDPNVTIDENGNIVFTGRHGCSDTDPAVIELTGTQMLDGVTTVGVGLVRVNCPANNVAFTVTVTPSLTAGPQAARLETRQFTCPLSGRTAQTGVITIANAVFGSDPPITPELLDRAFQVDSLVVACLQDFP